MQVDLLNIDFFPYLKMLINLFVSVRLLGVLNEMMVKSLGKFT